MSESHRDEWDFYRGYFWSIDLKIGAEKCLFVWPNKIKLSDEIYEGVLVDGWVSN